MATGFTSDLCVTRCVPLGCLVFLIFPHRSSSNVTTRPMQKTIPFSGTHPIGMFSLTVLLRNQERISQERGLYPSAARMAQRAFRHFLCCLFSWFPGSETSLHAATECLRLNESFCVLTCTCLQKLVTHCQESPTSHPLTSWLPRKHLYRIRLLR